MLSDRGLCDELITRPEEFYRLCCVVVCDLETSRIGALYIYDISSLRVKGIFAVGNDKCDLSKEIAYCASSTTTSLFCITTCIGGKGGGAQLVEALRYKSEGRGFDYLWCYWNFSLT